MPAKVRTTLYYDAALMAKVEQLAARRGWTKSSVAEAAIASFFSADAAERQEAALSRRLDRLSRQLDRLAWDQTLAVETLALFIRHWLTVTPPAPADQQAAARAKGRERYEAFVEALVRRLASATRLGAEVSRDVDPAAEPAGLSAEEPT
ncbi:MAG TPA: CopG family transcriptional regulator [Caulobacteraceae bacterium]|jgi:glucan phosphorylase|nr:CopG family transcriptional regulator [Caulobacteraceae bacterium]